MLLERVPRALPELVGVHAARRYAAALQFLDQGQDAVVGGQSHHGFLDPDPAVDCRQQIGQQTVEAQVLIHRFLAVGAVTMADTIRCGEADGQQIGFSVRAQLAGVERGEGGLQRQLVVKRRHLNPRCDVFLRQRMGERYGFAVGFGRKGVFAGELLIERAVCEESFPDLSGILCCRPGCVESGKPLRHAVRVIR